MVLLSQASESYPPPVSIPVLPQKAYLSMASPVQMSAVVFLSAVPLVLPYLYHRRPDPHRHPNPRRWIYPISLP